MWTNHVRHVEGVGRCIHADCSIPYKCYIQSCLEGRLDVVHSFDPASLSARGEGSEKGRKAYQRVSQHRKH